MSGPGIGVCRCRAFSRSLSGDGPRAGVSGRGGRADPCGDGLPGRLPSSGIRYLAPRSCGFVSAVPQAGGAGAAGPGSSAWRAFGAPGRGEPAGKSVVCLFECPCLPGRALLAASPGFRRRQGALRRELSAVVVRAAGAFCGRGPRGGRSGFCRAPRAFDVARAAGPMSAAVFPAESRMAGAWRSAGTSPRHDLHFSGRSRAELRGAGIGRCHLRRHRLP